MGESMRKLKEFNCHYILLDPKPGTNIGACIVEAELVALEENANVHFMFNNKLYRIYFNDLIAAFREE